MKYVCKEHAQHLNNALDKHYKLLAIGQATVYQDNIGLGLQQIPGAPINAKLLAESFKQFQHKAGKLQHAPYQSGPIQYVPRNNTQCKN
jgi:hypothetical protein